ncbi:hypothetical protein M3Y94_01246400 [Aphelenchoides besseyi]|nr:hypothetical protein M3Y94_01246400 [Aphelenchoides besseyi]
MFAYQPSLLIPLFVLVIGADGRKNREQNKSTDRFPEMCQGRAHLCERSDYRKVMSQMCAKTCSQVSEQHEQATSPSTPTNFSCGGKADKIEDCSQRTSDCARPEYRRLMTRYCCHTCTEYLKAGNSTDNIKEQNEVSSFKSG